MKVKSFRRTWRENKYFPPQLFNMNFKHSEKFEGVNSTDTPTYASIFKITDILSYTCIFYFCLEN